MASSGNGYCESFNSELRDELLNSEIYYSLEVQIAIERWRVHYNTIRPHSSLGYRPPAPETIVPLLHHAVARLQVRPRLIYQLVQKIGHAKYLHQFFQPEHDLQVRDRLNALRDRTRLAEADEPEPNTALQACTDRPVGVYLGLNQSSKRKSRFTPRNPGGLRRTKPPGR
jgi:putative transposase